MFSLDQMERDARFFKGELERHEHVIQHMGVPIRKAGAEVGSPTQGQAVTGSAFGVLIPQDMSAFVYSTIAKRAERCILMSELPRENVAQVIYERPILRKHGNVHMSAGVSEAGIPGVDQSTYDKIISTRRYWNVQRQITHVAENVAVLGTFYPQVGLKGKGGLEWEQKEGAESLVEKMEIAYWNAQTAVANGYEGSGFFEQVINGGTAGINYIDMRGASLDFDNIVDALAGVIVDGYEGSPSKAYIPSQVWKRLTKEAADKNRLNPSQPGDVMWNKEMKQLLLIGPTGKPIVLREARLMHPEYELPDAAYGDFKAVVANDLTLTSPVGANEVPAQTSYFTDDDVGTYIYKFIARFAKGHTTVATKAGLAIAAGDVAKFVWDDADDYGADSTSGEFLGYAIWRSDKDSTTKFRFLGYFGQAAAGATTFYDTNARIPGTYRSALIHFEDGAVTDDVLLDSFQYPLAPVERRRPFLLGRYSNISVNMPRKQVVFDNIAG